MTFSHPLCCKVSTFSSVKRPRFRLGLGKDKGLAAKLSSFGCFGPSQRPQLAPTSFKVILSTARYHPDSLMGWCQCMIQTSDTSKDFSPTLEVHATTTETSKILSHLSNWDLFSAHRQAFNHALSLDAQKWVLVGVRLVSFEFNAIKAGSAQALGVCS